MYTHTHMNICTSAPISNSSSNIMVCQMTAYLMSKCEVNDRLAHIGVVLDQHNSFLAVVAFQI